MNSSHQSASSPPSALPHKPSAHKVRVPSDVVVTKFLESHFPVSLRPYQLRAVVGLTRTYASSVIGGNANNNTSNSTKNNGNTVGAEVWDNAHTFTSCSVGEKESNAVVCDKLSKKTSGKNNNTKSNVNNSGASSSEKRKEQTAEVRPDPLLCPVGGVVHFRTGAGKTNVATAVAFVEIFFSRWVAAGGCDGGEGVGVVGGNNGGGVGAGGRREALTVAALQMVEEHAFPRDIIMLTPTKVLALQQSSVFASQFGSSKAAALGALCGIDIEIQVAIAGSVKTIARYSHHHASREGASRLRDGGKNGAGTANLCAPSPHRLPPKTARILVSTPGTYIELMKRAMGEDTSGEEDGDEGDKGGGGNDGGDAAYSNSSSSFPTPADCSTIFFDEVHHCASNHPYARVATLLQRIFYQEYELLVEVMTRKKQTVAVAHGGPSPKSKLTCSPIPPLPRMVGLTATLAYGSTEASIKKGIKNLFAMVNAPFRERYATTSEELAACGVAEPPACKVLDFYEEAEAEVEEEGRDAALSVLAGVTYGSDGKNKHLCNTNNNNNINKNDTMKNGDGRERAVLEGTVRNHSKSFDASSTEIGQKQLIKSEGFPCTKKEGGGLTTYDRDKLPLSSQSSTSSSSPTFFPSSAALTSSPSAPSSSSSLKSLHTCKYPKLKIEDNTSNVDAVVDAIKSSFPFLDKMGLFLLSPSGPQSNGKTAAQNKLWSPFSMSGTIAASNATAAAAASPKKRSAPISSTCTPSPPNAPSPTHAHPFFDGPVHVYSKLLFLMVRKYEAILGFDDASHGGSLIGFKSGVRLKELGTYVMKTLKMEKKNLISKDAARFGSEEVGEAVRPNAKATKGLQPTAKHISKRNKTTAILNSSNRGATNLTATDDNGVNVHIQGELLCVLYQSLRLVLASRQRDLEIAIRFLHRSREVFRRAGEELFLDRFVPLLNPLTGEKMFNECERVVAALRGFLAPQSPPPSSSTSAPAPAPPSRNPTAAQLDANFRTIIFCESSLAVAVLSEYVNETFAVSPSMRTPPPHSHSSASVPQCISPYSLFSSDWLASTGNDPAFNIPHRSQSEQDEIVSNFREGVFNVLCATTVVEEGLDVSTVRCIIHLSPPTNPVSQTQRSGRARDGGTNSHSVVLSAEDGAQVNSLHHAASLQDAIAESLSVGPESSVIPFEVGRREAIAARGNGKLKLVNVDRDKLLKNNALSALALLAQKRIIPPLWEVVRPITQKEGSPSHDDGDGTRTYSGTLPLGNGNAAKTKNNKDQSKKKKTNATKPRLYQCTMAFGYFDTVVAEPQETKKMARTKAAEALFQKVMDLCNF